MFTASKIKEITEMLLNEKIVVIRKLNNLTQEVFAEELGVSRQALSKWEKGESLPDIEKCQHLDDLISYEREDKENLGLGVPPKGKHIFGMVKVGDKGQIVIPSKARKIFDIQPGDNLIVLGDEGQGIAIIKEKGLLNLLSIAGKKSRD